MRLRLRQKPTALTRSKCSPNTVKKRACPSAIQGLALGSRFQGLGSSVGCSVQGHGSSAGCSGSRC